MRVRRKQDIDAPCKFLLTDDDGKANERYPAIDCDYKCAFCAWNPAEQKRRLNCPMEKNGRYWNLVIGRKNEKVSTSEPG